METEDKNNRNIDLFDYIELIFSKKFTILIFVSSFIMVSLIISFLLNDKYSSSALIKLSTQNDSSSISGISSQYGGLASLVGISLPSSSQNQEEFVIEFIKSKEFLKHLLEFEKVKENLFATKYFDNSSNKIVYDSKMYDSVSDKWVRNVKYFQSEEPSYVEIHPIYLKNLNIVKDRQSNFISLDFRSESPYFANQFLELIVNELNSILRKKDLSESSMAVKYLTQEQLKSKTLVENEAISNLMEEQLKTQMLSNLKEDYKVEYIDPPFIPEVPSAPNRIFIIIIAFIIGFISSLIYILYPNFRQQIK